MLADQLTVEKLFHDCLDVRFLRRKGFFDCGSATLGPSLKWPVPLMRIARYLLILKSQGTMLEAGLSTRMGRCRSEISSSLILKRTTDIELVNEITRWPETAICDIRLW
jgi:hypothetical protein